MKSQVEELHEVKQKVKIWETTKKKWLEALLFYKQQQKALGSEVEAFIKEKKEKENVLIDLELMNLKNISLLNFEQLKRKTIAAEKEKLVEENKEYQRNLQPLQAQVEVAQEQKKSLDPTGLKQRLEDYEQMLQYYTLMKDYEVESKEWWEVEDEYFTKGLKKNLAQHKTNEIFLKYKLEVY